MCSSLTVLTLEHYLLLKDRFCKTAFNVNKQIVKCVTVYFKHACYVCSETSNDYFDYDTN